MKFFTLLPIFSLFALTLSAAIGSFEQEASELSAALDKRQDELVPTRLPDGRISVALYDGGVFSGTMLERPDGDVTFLDAEGNAIDIDDEAKLMKRATVASVAKKLGPFIRKWGRRAWVG